MAILNVLKQIICVTAIAPAAMAGRGLRTLRLMPGATISAQIGAD